MNKLEANSISNSETYARYHRVGYALAIIVFLVSLAEIARNVIHPTNLDFISFWGAARLAISGTPALAYDQIALHAVQTAAATFDNGEMPFPYCPTFLLIVVPFALLPFPYAMALWCACTFVLFIAIVRAFAPQMRWLVIGFPPVFVVAAIGQNGFLTASLFIGGLCLFSRQRHFMAGLVLGCLVLKPQLAIMLPVAMIAGREWRIILGALLSCATVMLVGLVAFGPAASHAWLEQLPLYAKIARDGLVGWNKLVSFYAATRQLGAPQPAAIIVHFIVTLFAATLVAKSWRSNDDALTKFAVLGAATMLASPYIYLYDSLVLLPAYALLIQQRTHPGLVGALWLAPLLVIAQNAHKLGGVNMGPFISLALLLLCWRARSNATRNQMGAVRANAPAGNRSKLGRSDDPSSQTA